MTKEKINIEKTVYGGSGLGYINGKACFVPYAVPGDELIISITNDKKDYCFGRIIEIEKTSESRVQPECPNFGMCGGCDYLNISYEKEIEFKKEILRNSLTRNSGSTFNIPEIDIITDSRYNYRSHASVKQDTESNKGFYQKDSNALIPFPKNGCLLLSKELKEKINITSFPKDKKEIKIACSSCKYDNKDTGEYIIKDIENSIIYEREINLFFQANRFLREQMLNMVAEYTDLTKTDSFLDIGCGVGFFSSFLARNSKHGYGIDINKESIKWANHNSDINKIKNVSFKLKSADGIFVFKDKINKVIVDPPRAGISKKARKALKALAPELIVYVSCNPSTFSRDIGDLTSAGYSMDKLTMIDMFPCTHHIEAIALLTRK